MQGLHVGSLSQSSRNHPATILQLFYNHYATIVRRIIGALHPTHTKNATRQANRDRNRSQSRNLQPGEVHAGSPLSKTTFPTTYYRVSRYMRGYRANTYSAVTPESINKHLALGTSYDGVFPMFAFKNTGGNNSELSGTRMGPRQGMAYISAGDSILYDARKQRFFLPHIEVCVPGIVPAFKEHISHPLRNIIDPQTHDDSVAIRKGLASSTSWTQLVNA
ncbi:hypothetical protein PG996_012410 [Apiospora saccharicola]|uniref:Uncharacterized protein n=1 Tax=Apiospora saccharicola TaxID=335842 RepID=A0ABR1U2I0_9PEZI